MVLAAGFLCRPVMIVWAMLLLGVGVWRPGHRFTVLVAGAIIMMSVAGWTIRNQRVMGHPIWATTHGGYTLLLGNNDSFYDHLERRWSAPDIWQAWLPWQRQPWDATDFLDHYEALPGEDEWFSDRRDAAAAKDVISRRPWMFFWSCADRVTRLWSPFAMRSGDRSVWLIVATGLFELGFLAAAGWGAVALVAAKRWAALWPVLSLVISLTAVHAIYWSNPRMRAPAVPALAALVAVAVRRDSIPQHCPPEDRAGDRLTR